MEIPFYKIGKQSTDSIIKLNANEGIDFLIKIEFLPETTARKMSRLLQFLWCR